MYLITNVLYLVALFCVSPVVLYRFIRYGRYKRCWRAKLLGLIPPIGGGSPKTVWLHAVSVGEVQLLKTLIEKFETHRSDLTLAISVSTDTGYEVAKQLYDRHYIFFAPLDFSWAVKRVFRIVKPSVLILAELELWPNLIQIAKAQRCRTLIVNGRLSKRSFDGYSKFEWFLRPSFNSLDWVGVQNPTYRDRFVKLGVHPDKACITGSIKFDGAESSRISQEVIVRKRLLGLNDDHVVWVCGSTQHPEESILLSIFQQLVKTFPQLRLILIPRHKERFSEVADLIAKTGLPWDRRSLVSSTLNQVDWKIFFGDTLGELRWWWGLADIGYVGGSFGDRGGQNMIEPCAYGVATSFGPNTKNFADIVTLLNEKNACKQFQKVEEIVPWMEEMIRSSESRKRLGAIAKEVAGEHRGAIDRTWAQLQPFLPPANASRSNLSID